MVQLPNTDKLRSDSDPPMAAPAAAAEGPAVDVKLEIEDPLEEEQGPLNKRSKLAAPPQEVTHYNLLEEPSPLGLRLRKSPSLLDLIQMRLSQANTNTNSSSCVTSIENSGTSKKKELKSTAVSVNTDKMKASNFPVNLLRIGAWECLSRYEGDLVAKCYFAKHKLVWEVLEGGLKSKIEIQWSDITALKANCPENGPGTLDIVLSRPPLFFKETDPQPRKHTLWQATSDFTGGQASVNRRHFLQCPQSLLSKNFEKLIQCDPRLHSLSQQPDISLELPYFEPRCSVLEDQVESKCHSFDDLEDDHGPASEFFDLGLPYSASPIYPASPVSTKDELQDSVVRAHDLSLQGTPSPSSGVDTRPMEENGSSGREEVKEPNWWDQLKVPGLKGSMSVSDLVNHIGNCISEQITSGNPSVPADALPNKEVLEDIAQYLLSDSQAASASDEKSLMSRVNSLCCLLQKDPAPAAQNPQTDDVDRIAGDNDSSDEEEHPAPKPENQFSNGVQQQPPISRNESFGELLMHLPRIASLPQFLFNISEDAENESG